MPPKRTLPFLMAIGMSLWPPAFGQTLKIMPLGDSITRGTNDINYPNGDIPGGYRKKLGELLTAQGVSFDFVGELTDNAAPGMDPDHNGNNGWRTDQMLAAVPAWLARDPQTVLLMAGTNDVVQGRPIIQAADHLENLIIKITSMLPNCRLYVATILPITQAWQGRSAEELNANANAYNAEVRARVAAQAAAGRKVFLVDMNAMVVLDDPDPLLDFYQPGDGIHPGQAGYEQLGNLWFQAITASGSLTETPPPDAPVKRTGFAANPVTPSRVNLSWTDPAADEHAVHLWMRELPTGVWQRVATLDADAVSHAVTGLSASSTSYRFAVEALNPQGTSGWSELATTSTLGAGGELALLKPASASTFFNPSFSPSKANDGLIDTLWASSGAGPHWWQVDLGDSQTISKIELVTRQDNNVADQRRNFEIRVSNDPAFATYTVLVTQGSTPLAHKATLTVQPDPPATGRYLRVAKTDNVSFSIAEFRVTPAVSFPPPAAPSDLAAAQISGYRVRLSWTVTSHNETGFRIERRDSPSGSFAPVGQAPALASSHEDMGLFSGSTYAYRVIAFNEAGDSVASPDVEITLALPDPYADWAATQPGLMELPEEDRLPGADPNRDGVVNLLAYAFGMNPLLPADPSRMPRITGTPPQLALEFVKRASSPDLFYQVQTSPDATGGSWTPAAMAGAVSTPHPVDPALENVTLPVVPSAEEPRLFFRLWVVGDAFTD